MHFSSLDLGKPQRLIITNKETKELYYKHILTEQK